MLRRARKYNFKSPSSDLRQLAVTWKYSLFFFFFFFLFFFVFFFFFCFLLARFPDWAPAMRGTMRGARDASFALCVEAAP